jgi:hypothetical protein
VAEADCGICEAMGYRSCDLCGGPAMTAALEHPYAVELGVEYCGYCLMDAVTARDSERARGV